MKKILYTLEIVVLFLVLLQVSLQYSGNFYDVKAITIPSFGEVKNSLSVKTDISDDSNISEDFFNDNNAQACASPQIKSVGLPFVYKTTDGCGREINYAFSLWLDYVTVMIVALGLTKLTSLAVNRIF